MAKDPKSASTAPVSSMWERLSWPQVVALAVLVAGVVAILIAVPEDKLPPWEVVGGVVLALAGGGASSMLGPLFRPAGAPARPSDPGSSTDGCISVRLLIAIPVFFALVVLVLSGCGAGALGGHRRAATYADLVARVVSAEVAEACPADAGTMSEECAIALPAAESLPALVTAYREGVKLAASIEDGSDVLGPLCALARPVLDVVDVVLGALGMPPELDAVLTFIRSLLATADPGPTS